MSRKTTTQKYCKPHRILRVSRKMKFATVRPNTKWKQTFWLNVVQITTLGNARCCFVMSSRKPMTTSGAARDFRISACRHSGTDFFRFSRSSDRRVKFSQNRRFPEADRRRRVLTFFARFRGAHMDATSVWLLAIAAVAAAVAAVEEDGGDGDDDGGDDDGPIVLYAKHDGGGLACYQDNRDDGGAFWTYASDEQRRQHVFHCPSSLSAYCVNTLTGSRSVRGCSAATGVNKAGCFKVVDDRTRVTSAVCLCKRNLCNAATAAAAASSLLTASAAAAIVFFRRRIFCF